MPQHAISRYPGSENDTVHQYAAEYYTIQPGGRHGTLTINLQGTPSVRIIGNDPYQSADEWWSNRYDNMDSTLTHSFDLTHVKGKHATLQFATWFDLEQNYDYAYVEVSTDGQKWTTLKGNYTTTTNATGANWGNGYTGESGESSAGSSPQWEQESVDLSKYVGKKVQIRFEEVTDDAVNWQGFALDDIRIPEIGFSDMALSDNGWVSNGFIRSQNELPEHFYMQALLYQGQIFTVTNVNVDLASGKGTLTIPDFGGKIDRVVLIVSASAAETTLPEIMHSIPLSGNRENGKDTLMNKKERVDAALRGDAVDRVPASMWGHDFTREWNVQTFVEAMVENFTRYDWDYMKVNPRAVYHVQDWGVKARPSGEPYKGPVFESSPIRGAADWKRIRPLEPDQGALGEQLRALQLINHSIGYDAYFVQTIFCPLGVAKYLAGNKNEPVLQTMHEDRKALHAALRVITETFTTYAIACLEQGASGIFYATNKWASESLLTPDQYREFGEQYDLEFLDAIKSRSKFNILHIWRLPYLLRPARQLSGADRQLGCSRRRQPRPARGQGAFRSGRHGRYQSEHAQKWRSRPAARRGGKCSRADQQHPFPARPRLLHSPGDTRKESRSHSQSLTVRDIHARHKPLI